jgi:hypothetical protein
MFMVHVHTAYSSTSTCKYIVHTYETISHFVSFLLFLTLSVARIIASLLRMNCDCNRQSNGWMIIQDKQDLALS